MSEPVDGDGAIRVPLDPSEPADGVKVDGNSNYFAWLEPELEPELDEDDTDPGLSGWAAFVWTGLLVMLCFAIGAAVAGL